MVNIPSVGEVLGLAGVRLPRNVMHRRAWEYNCDGDAGMREGQGVFCGNAGNEMGCNRRRGSGWYWKQHPNGPRNAEWCYDSNNVISYSAVYTCWWKRGIRRWWKRAGGMLVETWVFDSGRRRLNFNVTDDAEFLNADVDLPVNGYPEFVETARGGYGGRG